MRSTRFDFWIAVVTAASTAAAFAAAIATLPKSGPFCADGCVAYPYTDIAQYIPSDFLWMYPGLLPAPLFVMLLGGIHRRARDDRRQFSGLAIAFAAMAAALLTGDYLIQLRVVQPAILNGEVDGLAALTQYNPHGVFIALEEAGYGFMALSFVFAGLAIPSQTRRFRPVRYLFIGGFATAVVVCATLSVAYGLTVEYRLEVALITVDWLVLIVAAAILAQRYWPPGSEQDPDICQILPR